MSNTLDEIRRKLAKLNSKKTLQQLEQELHDQYEFVPTDKYNNDKTMYAELEAQYLASKLRTGIRAAITEKEIDYNVQYEESVVCPECNTGTGYPGEIGHMHHFAVEIFSCVEDKPGEHIIIGGGGFDMTKPNIMVDTNMDQNPSSRRGGILIHFKCEDCGGIQTMQIAQHKGSSLLGWAKNVK